MTERWFAYVPRDQWEEREKEGWILRDTFHNVCHGRYSVLMELPSPPVAPFCARAASIIARYIMSSVSRLARLMQSSTNPA